MKSCVIFAGGDAVSEKTVDFSLVKNSLVICADRGYILAKNLGVVPNIILGDFDSCNINSENTHKIIVKTFPPEKDDTDLLLAVKEGFSQGCEDFTIYGALGGRFDHTWASVQTLAYILSRNGHGKIISDKDKIELLTSGSYKIDKIENRYFSLFAYSEDVTNLTIKGAKYNVENITLNSCFPLGVSNEITAAFAEITFDNGILLTVHSQKN